MAPSPPRRAGERMIGRGAGVLAESGISGEAVLGVGVDFTDCTALPATAEGRANQAPYNAVRAEYKRLHDYFCQR